MNVTYPASRISIGQTVRDEQAEQNRAAAAAVARAAEKPLVSPPISIAAIMAAPQTAARPTVWQRAKEGLANLNLARRVAGNQVYLNFLKQLEAGKEIAPKDLAVLRGAMTESGISAADFDRHQAMLIALAAAKGAAAELKKTQLEADTAGRDFESAAARLSEAIAIHAKALEWHQHMARKLAQVRDKAAEADSLVADQDALYAALADATG